MVEARPRVGFSPGGDLGMTFWYLGIAAVFFVLLSFIP